MTATRLFFRAAAVCACLLLALPARGDVAEPAASTAVADDLADSSRVARARALANAGRFEAALVLLTPLVRDGEAGADALFLFGLAAIGASRKPGLDEDDREAFLDGAVGAFRRMLIDEPGLVRVRLELARAFFLKGEDGLARRHFEYVLAGDPPGPVVANVSRFLALIRARRRWDMHAGFALAPDTNIGASSGERIIYVDVGGQRLPFRRDAEDLTTSGVGLSVWTGGEYQFPLSERLRLRAGANLSRREYSGSRFDQTFVSGHAGPRWLLGRTSEASALASVQRRWSAGAPNHDAFGVRLEAGRRFNLRVTAHARASWAPAGPPHADVPRRADGRRLARRRLGGDPDGARGCRAGLGPRPSGDGALAPRAALGGGPGSRWPCPRASPSAAAASCAGPTTRATGPPTPPASRAPTAPGACAPRCTTVPSPGRASAPRCPLVHEVRSTNAQLYDYRRTGGELRFVRLF